MKEKRDEQLHDIYSLASYLIARKVFFYNYLIERSCMLTVEVPEIFFAPYFSSHNYACG